MVTKNNKATDSTTSKRKDNMWFLFDLRGEYHGSESPACNWGFRGMTGDEASLDYKIDV